MYSKLYYSFFFSVFINLSVCICVCVYGHTHVFCRMNMEVGGQLTGVNSLLVPCGAWGAKLRSSELVASICPHLTSFDL